jgi:thioesterase domain-containing protein
LAKLDPDDQFKAALAKARQSGIIPTDTPESFIRRLVQVGKSNVLSIQSYEPRPLATAAAMFVPRVQGGLADVSGQQVSTEPDNGWRAELRQAIELHEVPGDHFTMMLNDGASQLAEEIARRIASAHLSAAGAMNGG